jgi:hypothetical protein
MEIFSGPKNDLAGKLVTPEIYIRSNNLIAANPWGSYWRLTFTKIAFFNYLPTFDPHLTARGSVKLSYF